MRIALSEATVGLVLSQDLLRKNGKVLLPCGTVLSERLIAGLRKVGIEHLQVDPPSGAKQAPDLSIEQQVERRFCLVKDDPFMQALKKHTYIALLGDEPEEPPEEYPAPNMTGSDGAKANEHQVSVARIIEQTEAIPTLSKVYARVQRLVSNPETTATDLARVVESDQSFTLRLLQLSNAAEQARLSAVTTVKQAIVVLGFRTVRAAALSSSVMGSMRHFTSGSVEALWQRAYATATASRLLAARLGMAEPEEAFVLGLVQNMGQIILSVKAPKAYAQVTQIIDKEPDTDIIAAEKRVLGITHQEVGYMLARRWQLPDVIAHVILRHHQPERAGKFRGPATLVYLADTMSRALGLGSDGDDYMRPLRISAARWKKLKLKLEDLEVIMKQTSADHSGFEDFYSTGTDS